MAENTNTTVPVGTLWELPAKEPLTIQRPDGREVTAFTDGKTATHVLDVPGEYVAGKSKIEAK